ncbi:MAG: SNF2-related protein, partial [Mariniphaga sp.]
MNLTAYHAKYFASELTKRCPSDSVEKLSATLVDAKVDLNPHQVEAALFAFRSPLSRGAILADEVGLGKTIEAGILLSQKWAEGKRKLLIICPSSLRKQWSQELADKFFLPSLVLEARTYNQFIKAGKRNPFNLRKIVICSYHFARNKADQISWIDWDIVVVDEAHRLRNVYKPDNKIGNAIKNAVYERPKVLLTATPLQNSLLELYGLVSIIDDNVFGDVKSFKAQFVRLNNEGDYTDLRDRLASICQRTLRKQVREYVPYTNRSSITVKFEPSPDEQALYELVTSYLQRELLYALPRSQRHLMTLILRKLLASSSFAIAGTLQSLYKRLEKLVDGSIAHHEELEHLEAEMEENLETYDEIKEEYTDEMEESDDFLAPEEIEKVRKEIDELKTFYELAQSITNNAKGENLMAALNEGFSKLKELGAEEKAIIFTESTRTQDYLLRLFENSEYKDQVVLFNGSNNDKKSKQIYETWIQIHKNSDKVSGSKAVDIRAALVDYFRDEAKIMIATEAAAEGINLQFCSMVVNYDLPWNPQRIEQRIGRCHRYGQKYDVVVVNFLNTKNAADQRVFQLLSEKFKLFDGVFGASDEVLGSIESGVDFEQRIAAIYQECRKPEEIQEAFDKLQEELADDIIENMVTSRQKLLENFDDEVAQKLRINRDLGKKRLNQFEQWLWNITRYHLAGYGDFDASAGSFKLNKNPFPGDGISTGKYQLLWQSDEHRKSETEIADDTRIYRIGHPLAKNIIDASKSAVLPTREVVFDYSNSGKNISVLEALKGSEGWMQISLLRIESFENEEHLLFAAFTDQGEALEAEVCKMFFTVGGREESTCAVPESVDDELAEMIALEKQKVEENTQRRNAGFYEVEYDKLENWVDDMKLSLEKEIKDIDAEIKLRKAEARKIFELDKKVAAQRAVKT